MSVSAEPPKLVVNEKRYGRRSKPLIDDMVSADDADVESITNSRPGSRQDRPDGSSVSVQSQASLWIEKSFESKYTLDETL